MNNNISITERYEIALKELDLTQIQELISELNAKPAKDKESFRDLYARIGEDLFQKDIDVRNYDLADYDNDISSWKTNKASGRVTARKEQVEPTRKSFDEIFCEFYAKSQDVFLDLKYHFLFQLDNASSQTITLLILTDDKFSDNPLIGKIIEANSEISPQKFTIGQFLDHISKQPESLENQYLLLLAISPTVGNNSEFRGLQEELFSKFQKCLIINPHKCSDISSGDYSYKTVDRVLLDKIEKITTNLLNNKAITHEEEKVIKLLLSKNTPITDYKILKAGFSGSKVIEVQPIRYLPSTSPIRYVIKFSQKTEERKIYYEKEAFKKCLQDLRVNGYSFEYIETDQCEAIQYNYASSDSRHDSHSYATLLADSLSAKSKLKHNLIDTLDQLFKCEPFKVWVGAVPVTKTVKSLYSKYLDEAKVLDAISTIENLEPDKVKGSDLWKRYEKVLTCTIQAKEKICHGDLHTENFFKDDDDVYLIDFGYTGENHAVMDHATLEASIKFKHIPFYSPIDELIEIEKKLLSEESFKEGYDLSFIKRPPILELFKIILKIRNEAVAYLRDPAKPLEYLISLFILSFRQIQYKDLNQRYALESAKFLSEYICSKI